MNPDYKYIERISLANNSLTSLRGIENSWLQTNGPVFLDIRSNNIKEVSESSSINTPIIFTVQLDTSYLELMLSKAVDKESVYFFAGNPWSCNCNNIKTIQEFLEKFSSIILDTEEMECMECDCSLLNLDYKEMCSTGSDSMLWLITLELCLLLLVLVKFSWDCVAYRRTGELPWLARNLCCSLQGITATNWCSRWLSRLPDLLTLRPQRVRGASRAVQRGSSGYITCSAASNNSMRNTPGNKESSVVRFI